MKWETESRTEKKKQGTVNEDFYKINEDYCIVSDGMSGKKAGNVASKMAIDYISEKVEKLIAPQDTLDEENFKRQIFGFIAQANENVYQSSIEKPEFQGMGATLDLLVRKGNKVFVFHVGDSSVFIMERDGSFKKITQDDTEVARLYSKNKIPKELVYTHPLRNKMEKIIGQKRKVVPSCIELSLDNIKYILMATDGIASYVTEEEIEKVMSDEKDKSGILNKLFEIRKNPRKMAQIFKGTSEEYETDKLSEICEILSDYDDATAIIIENTG